MTMMMQIIMTMIIMSDVIIVCSWQKDGIWEGKCLNLELKLNWNGERGLGANSTRFLCKSTRWCSASGFTMRTCHSHHQYQLFITIIHPSNHHHFHLIINIHHHHYLHSHSRLVTIAIIVTITITITITLADCSKVSGGSCFTSFLSLLLWFWNQFLTTVGGIWRREAICSLCSWLG